MGWALPGGFVDYGESVEEAAAREVWEETGLSLSDLKQFHVYSRPDRDPRQHNISIVFTANGSGVLRAGDDARGGEFFPLVSPPSPLRFDHAEIFDDYREETGQA